MEKEKNILIIILTIIIIVLCFVVGWLFNGNEDQVIDDLPNEENKEIKEEKDLNEVANDLLERVSNVYMCGEVAFDLEEKNKLTYKDLDKTYIDSYVARNLFIDNKVEKHLTDSEYPNYSVSSKNFEDEFKKIFGSNVSFELPQTFHSGFIKFDLDGDVYKGNIMTAGCGGSPEGEYILDEYKKENNKFYLTVLLIYSIGNDQYVSNPNINFPDENLEGYTKEQLLQEHKSEITKYKYIFNLENDNYIFDSIELVN